MKRINCSNVFLPGWCTHKIGTCCKHSQAACTCFGGGSSFKAGASRRLAWAAAGRSAASPSCLDPTAGVSGFLLRARTALREAGGAEKYAQENRSGANGRAALAEMLAERMSGCEDGVGVGRGSEAAGGKKAKAKVSQPALPLAISWNSIVEAVCPDPVSCGGAPGCS